MHGLSGMMRLKGYVQTGCDILVDSNDGLCTAYAGYGMERRRFPQIFTPDIVEWEILEN